MLVEKQKQARANRRGLWGAYEIISHTDASRYLNQIRTVRGRILSTHKSKKCVFLNFGSDYRTDFTVVIFNNVLDAFYDLGIDPVTAYRGMPVEVSGRIREYNGPEIIVSHPYQISIVE